MTRHGASASNQPPTGRGSAFTKSILNRDQRLRALLVLASGADADLSKTDHRVLMLLLIDGPLRRHNKVEATYRRIQIADHLGITRAMVSRSLAHLEEVGFITTTSHTGRSGGVTVSINLPDLGDPHVPQVYPFQAWNKDSVEALDGLGVGPDITPQTAPAAGTEPLTAEDEETLPPDPSSEGVEVPGQATPEEAGSDDVSGVPGPSNGASPGTIETANGASAGTIRGRKGASGGTISGVNGASAGTVSQGNGASGGTISGLNSASGGTTSQGRDSRTGERGSEQESVCGHRPLPRTGVLVPDNSSTPPLLREASRADAPDARTREREALLRSEAGDPNLSEVSHPLDGDGTAGPTTPSPHRVVDLTHDDEDIALLDPAAAEQMVGTLMGVLTPDQAREFDRTRQVEITQGLLDLTQTETLTRSQTLYLLGYWAGDRRLRNANHFAEHATRNRGLAQAASGSTGLDEQAPAVCVQWGMAHGKDARSRRRRSAG